MGQQGVACGREMYGAAAALNQLHLQLIFELLDVGRHIGLHGVQALGRRPKTAGTGHGVKNAQGFDLHGTNAFDLQHHEKR